MDPAAFSKATIIPGEGWTVEWPDVDIQIGADTLWLDAQAQNASDENAPIFGRWRARHGLSLKDAAAALGVTPRTVSAYTAQASDPCPAISIWPARAGKRNRSGMLDPPNESNH